MKKAIILCIVSTIISTTMFSMLTKTLHTKRIIKNIEPKKFCEKKPFNYEEIILEKVAENIRLKKEIHSLKQQLKLSLNQENTIELCHRQEQLSFMKDRRSSGEE